MTIQLLTKSLIDLMHVEEKISRLQAVAEENGIVLPDEDKIIEELIKAQLSSD